MLDLHNITKTFTNGSGPVLRNANLRLERTEIAALIGPSGCGKTTLLRIAAGLEVPDAGTVTLADQVVASNTQWVRPERRSVGIVFQDGALFPHMTVERNIVYGISRLPVAERRERVTTLLDMVKMRSFEKRYPHQLSGGEQQRVALARALAARPQVLLLDEPFSHLDTELKHALRLEVRQILGKLGITVLLVTHDREDAEALGARIVTIRNIDP